MGVEREGGGPLSVPPVPPTVSQEGCLSLAVSPQVSVCAHRSCHSRKPRHHCRCSYSKWSLTIMHVIATTILGRLGSPHRQNEEDRGLCPPGDREPPARSEGQVCLGGSAGSPGIPPREQPWPPGRSQAPGLPRWAHGLHTLSYRHPVLHTRLPSHQPVEGVPRPSLRGVPGSVNRWAVLASSLPAPFDSASCLPAQASPLPIPPCSMRDLCWLNSVSSETELWWGRDAVIYSPVFPEPGTASGTHRRVPRVAPGAGL